MTSDLGVLAAPFFAASAVLAWSGGTKLARPTPAAQTMHRVGLPASLGAARALGATELAIGVAALLSAHRVAALALAAVYLALGVFAAYLLRREADAECGCFGTSSAPVGTAHLIVDGAAAAVAVAVAVDPFGSLTDVLGAQPLAGLPFAALTALLAWLTVVTMTDLTTLLRVARAGGSR
jgi:hypothetical protein